MDCGGHATNLPTASLNRPLRHVELDGGAVDLDADEFALRPFILNSLEGRLPDEIGWLREVHGPAQADLIGVVLDRHVRAVVEDPRFDAADVGGPRRPDVVSLSGLHERVP